MFSSFVGLLVRFYQDDHNIMTDTCLTVIYVSF